MRLCQDVELFYQFDNGFYSTKKMILIRKNSPFNMDEIPIKNDIFMHGKEKKKIISFLQQFLNHHLE